MPLYKNEYNDTVVIILTYSQSGHEAEDNPVGGGVGVLRPAEVSHTPSREAYTNKSGGAETCRVSHTTIKRSRD